MELDKSNIALLSEDELISVLAGIVCKTVKEYEEVTGKTIFPHVR